jgi:CO/xanthine dehydrogenase Mo-binding subunit
LRSQAAEGGSASEVDSFLAIHQDGSATIYTSHVDVGTGITTAYRQIAAEELGIPVERFTVVQGNTGEVPNHGGTGGSSGIPRGGADIRRAAATAHAALVNLACAKLGKSTSEIRIENGVARAASGESVSVGELIGGKRFNVKVNNEAPLKDPKSYATVGKPIPRPDLTGKATGRYVYVQDFKVPGMLHARVVRPDVIGAKLVSVDEQSIAGIPKAKVVRLENFVAVVAENEWAAIRAAKELKIVWSEGAALPVSATLAADLQAEAASVSEQYAPSREGVGGAGPIAKTVSATLYWPYQTHGSLGPSCAIADVRSGGATIWSATQDTYGVRGLTASVLKLPANAIQVNYMDGSGSYGTNGAPDAAIDAVLISRAVGKPVRLQWMRQDELIWDPKGPAHLLKLQAGLDDRGNLATWEGTAIGPAGPQWNGSLLGAVGAGVLQVNERGGGAPVTQNMDPPYAVGSIKITSKTTKSTPIRLSNLRAPGKMATVSVVEILTDEAARAAGADPVAYRKGGLKDPRALAVIDRAATLFGWKTGAKATVSADGSRSGQGFAYVRYKHAETYVAMAMDVTVRPSGEVIVNRVVCAHDCGQIVNPDGLRNQVEGNIVQGISRALYEEFTTTKEKVVASDWVSYPILRFSAAPIVEVELIDRPGETAYGAGEAAGSPVTAALANAIFHATGARMTAVPFTPKRVKSVLAAG